MGILFRLIEMIGGGLNCSQLVWAAYYYGVGIDLAPGHPFIAPVTLTMSPVASRYDTIQP